MWESGKLPVCYILGSADQIATRSAFQSRLDVRSILSVDRYTVAWRVLVCVCSTQLISLQSVAVVIINI